MNEARQSLTAFQSIRQSRQMRREENLPDKRILEMLPSQWLQLPKIWILQ